MSGKAKVIIYATCQGEYLANLLRCSPAFCRNFDLEYHSNISRPGVFNSDGIEYASIADCAFFFYHRVRSPKNIRVVKQVLELLPAAAKCVPLPYLTSNLYWPLCDTSYVPIGASLEGQDDPLPYAWPLAGRILDLERTPARIAAFVYREAQAGIFPYAWPLADQMLAAGHAPARIAALIHNQDPASLVDLEQLRQATFSYWKSLDEQGEIKVYDFLLANWQKQMLFYLYNHPAKPLFLHLAAQVLGLLGLPPLDPELASQAYLAQDQVYPVHPALAGSLGLGFVSEYSQYAYRGQQYSFYAFLRHYLEIRRKLAKLEQAA